MQSPTVKPANFRVNKFTLGGKDVLIAGMARPNYNDEHTVQARLKYLRDVENRTVLIGLYQNSFEAQAKAQGLEYYHIPVHDLPGKGHPISPERYDKIYEVVKKATSEGKLVTIHCGAGDGRSGTALASLKLRELLEQQARINVSALDEIPQKTEVVHVSYLGSQYVKCTKLVRLAVEAVRQQRIVSSNADLSGSHSVETENDIDTLMNYEAHLRQKIKQELQVQGLNPAAPGPFVAPAPVVAPIPAAVPKTVTHWDAFVGLVNAIVAFIKQLVSYVFGQSGASKTPPGGMAMNTSSHGFFSNMPQSSVSKTPSTNNLVI